VGRGDVEVQFVTGGLTRCGPQEGSHFQVAGSQRVSVVVARLVLQPLADGQVGDHLDGEVGPPPHLGGEIDQPHVLPDPVDHVDRVAIGAVLLGTVKSHAPA
jgi:hypothetical protein